MTRSITIPTQNGAYPGIDEPAYHADTTSLSVSSAKLLLPPSTPAKFRQHIDNPPPPKPVFNFGSLVHKLVLGEGADIIVIDADDWRSKTAQTQRNEAHALGQIPCLKTEHAKAQQIADSVKAHPLAGPMLEAPGESEVSMYATDPGTGIRLRGRTDRTTTIDDRFTIIDVKTCADASPTEWSRAAARYMYEMQHAWYVALARLIHLSDDPRFLFVCVEKEPPYLVAVHELDDEAVAEGRRKMGQAIDSYKTCIETNEWPGYPNEINTISLPMWALTEQDILI